MTYIQLVLPTYRNCSEAHVHVASIATSSQILYTNLY